MADCLYLMSFLEGPPSLGEALEEEFIQNLHLTIMGNFSIPDSCLPIFVQGLDALSRWFKRPELTVAGFTEYGASGEIPVALVENRQPTPERDVRLLHESALALLRNSGGTVHSEEFTGKNYSPHVSHLYSKRPFTLESFTLVHHQEGFGVNVVNKANYFFAL